MRSKILKAAIVQQPCVEDRATNLRMSEEGIRAAAAGGAQLVLLQELQRTVMQGGVVGLAERLCSIEAQWHSSNFQHENEAGSPIEELAQLDLLLQSIRNDEI